MIGDLYVNIPRDNLFDSAAKFEISDQFVSQHDNDPKHTSSVASKYFDENKIPILPWPANSPGLHRAP